MTGINSLNDVLRVRAVIRSDYGRCFGSLLGKNGWGKGKCVEISAFCYVYQDVRVRLMGKYWEPTDCGVLEDDQEARIIDPLDLKPSPDIFPL